MLINNPLPRHLPVRGTGTSSCSTPRRPTLHRLWGHPARCRSPRDVSPFFRHSSRVALQQEHIYPPGVKSLTYPPQPLLLKVSSGLLRVPLHVPYSRRFAYLARLFQLEYTGSCCTPNVCTPIGDSWLRNDVTVAYLNDRRAQSFIMLFCTIHSNDPTRRPFIITPTYDQDALGAMTSTGKYRCDVRALQTTIGRSRQQQEPHLGPGLNKTLRLGRGVARIRDPSHTKAAVSLYHGTDT